MEPNDANPSPGSRPETGPGEPEAGETPSVYGFDLDPGEQVTRVIHRSIFDFLPSFFTSLLIFVAALALIYFEARFAGNFPFPPMLVLALVLLLISIAVLIFFVGLYVFRRNVLVFTNEHLIQVEVNSLFSHRVSQVAFTRIQDVSGIRTGVLQTIFNFGIVEIQSAGEQEKFIFRNAPNPQEIADEALEIHEEALRRAHELEPEE
jgi:membrane protein YdbS with pleckstrin-like domain